MTRRGLVAVAAAVAVLGSGAPALATPGPPSAPEYWFDDWQLPSLWSVGARGQGVTIAEIDTGVNADLPELRGRVVKGKDFGARGDGRVDREQDAFGHGTAMASIMIARPGLLGITGIAPGAKVLPIAVPLLGTTDSERPDRLPDAIRWAADHHARIISMSLGGKRSPKYDTEPCSDAEQAAIYYALGKGSLVLASIGNTGPTRNAVEDPAVCLGVVSVGAEDQAGTVADFSTRQPYLTFIAPGVNVPSLGRIAGQAYSGDGTSQATAVASAVAALVWSRYPRLTGPQVVARILATLDDRRARPSPSYGYGRLDAYRAVTAPVPTAAADPVQALAAPFLARSAALAQAPPRAPAPAASPSRPTGSYAVGDPPGSRASVVPGTLLAAAGLLLLLALLLLGRRSRRRPLAPVAEAQPLPLPLRLSPPVAALPPVPWPPEADPAQPRRPRPGPGVSPEP